MPFRVKHTIEKNKVYQFLFPSLDSKTQPKAAFSYPGLADIFIRVTVIP